MSFLYILLAAFGLGLLVFIHELGHYFAAKRVKIKIETFSIGFGRPIVRWMRGDVEWRIGWLPFGGYVKMAGMDKQGDRQPWEIPGGFFHARPIDRIKVALAGPAVNIFFAFLLFSIIWISGGREKPFSNLTQRIGWVDEQSALYDQGLRPGDLITSYNGRAVGSMQDHLYAAMLLGNRVRVDGYKVNYERGTKTPFEMEAVSYPHPQVIDDDILTLGVLQPAQYLIYQPREKGITLPVDGSGIEPGDRLLWVDGKLLFSATQLGSILNDGKALLSIERGGDEMLVRVPRVRVGDLNLQGNSVMRDELNDWSYEAGVSNGFFLPYDISPIGVVEGNVPLIDDLQKVEMPLQMGDRILAVDGQLVRNGADILKQLQSRQVNVIVQRQKWPVVSWKKADESFDADIHWSALEKLSVGTPGNANSLVMLKSITPITLAEFSKQDPEVLRQLTAVESEIRKIPDPVIRQETLEEFQQNQGQYVLGVQLTDRLVAYNPPPTTLFANAFLETGRTLKALVTGNLSPKFLSGPVGIVQVMHYGWTIGIKEALFWLALISLNLGLLNLLPVPILDGGHVCFSLWEMITKRKIKAETMEKLVIPFVILLIGFFVFVTYQDITRLIRGFF